MKSWKKDWEKMKSNKLRICMGLIGLIVLNCFLTSLIMFNRNYEGSYFRLKPNEYLKPSSSVYPRNNEYLRALDSVSATLQSNSKIDLSDVHASFLGEESQAQSGTSIAGLGDVNGDGYDDILIGAHGMDGDAGNSFLFFGRPSGNWQRDTSISTANITFLGEAEGDFSGVAVAGAGDVNGDGYNDIIIGAPSFTQVSETEARGKAYVYFGRPTNLWSSTINLTDANIHFLGALNSRTGSSVGSALNFAGDTHPSNGNDIDTFMIGAFAHTNYRGRTYLICGDSTWTTSTQLTIDPNNLSPSIRMVRIDGEVNGAASGIAIAGVGDVNNDDYDDVVISAPYDNEGGTQAGQVYLILGRSVSDTLSITLSNTDASFYGENANDRAGLAISGAGDVNKDGFNDILIGAPENEDGGVDAGKVYIIFGQPTNQWHNDVNLTDANASFIGESSSDFLGCAVAGGGDPNKDGYSDILIGAYGNEEGGSGAGKTYLLIGQPTMAWGTNLNISSEAALSFIGERDNSHSGEALAWVGDVDNDSFNDLLIGAPADDEGESVSGQTYLYLGIPFELSILSPLPQIYITPTITVDLAAEHAAHFWYRIAGIDQENLSWSTPIQRTLLDGTYTLNVYANNTLGVEVYSNVTFTIDTTPPFLSIAAPEATSYDDQRVLISLSGDANYYWYYIAGVDSTNQTWTTNLNRTLTDGTYTLHAFGNDTVGNIAHSSVTFTIDTILPIVNIDSPTSTAYTTGTVTVALSGDADHYWYYIAGVDATNQTWTTNQDRTLTDGTYTLHMFGNDTAGNIAHSSVTFSIDTIEPVVTIIQPANTTYTQDSVILTYQTSEAGSVTILIDNILSTSITNNSIISGLSIGIHNITVIITDDAGNIGTATIIFTIDIHTTTSTDTSSSTTTFTTSTTTPSSPTTTIGWNVLILFLSMISSLLWRRYRIRR